MALALGGEDGSEAEAAAFRPRPRPWIRALAANFTLLGLLVGVPYFRGHRRAEESVAAFPAFAACFFGGTARPGGGLSIPVGDREAYATLVLSGRPTWPLDCGPALDAVALSEVTFLLPAVKQGEVEVRAGAETMREELASLAARRSEDDVVPERPLLAFARLQAALSTLLLSVGDGHGGALEAVTLDVSPRLPAPSRIPLRVAEGGSFLARASASSLRLVTTDASRASMVTVELAAGRVLEALVRRPRAARQTTTDAEHGHLLFVTSETTCAEDAARCANRLMGVTRIDAEVERPEAELWLRAHPRGRADRAARIDGASAWIVARTLAGGSELRAFALDWPGDADEADAPEGGGSSVTAAADDAGALAEERADADPGLEESPSASASAVRATFAVDLGDVDVLLGPGWARFLRGRELREVTLDAVVPPAAAADSPGELGIAAAPAPSEHLVGTLAIDATRIWGCDGWTVAAGPSALEIVAPGGAPHFVWDAHARQPLSGAAPEDEPLSLACDEAGLGVAVVDEHRALVVALCTAAGCEIRTPDAGVLDGASIALEGSAARVATWRDEGAIFLHTLARPAVEGAPDADAVPEPDAGIVAACWERGRGFCGPARFVPGAGRPLLLARDGTDAIVLVHDEGWRALPGLGAPLALPAAAP